MDSEDIALAVLAAVEGVHAYSAFLPSIFTIRHFANDVGTTEDIKLGLVLAGGFTGLLAAAVAAIVDSTLPLWLGLTTIVLMTAIYGWAGKNPREGGTFAK